MKDEIWGVYHKLPGPMQIVAASLHGFYLRSWRYSAKTEQLVDEAIGREEWGPEQWKTWRENRLAFVLHRAATQVPYYRDQWAQRRRDGDRASWEYLENWPILEKEPVRENSRAFVSEECDVRKMFHENTSGTSGKALDLWWSRATVEAWYALYEARCRRWYGVSRNDRWAILGGQPVCLIHHRRPPFWVWNLALRQLYMSSYHLAPDLIPYYLDVLQRYRIKYLLGYTSSLYALALEVMSLKRRDLKLTVAITNAEPVFDYQRQIIMEAFQCPVYETYGMAEIVAAASECQFGSLHLWPEVGLIEVLNGSQVASNGEVGDLVCTGLFNRDMPLIRYSVGDRGSLPRQSDKCACGRSLPSILAIEGRTDDILFTTDGRRIGRLDPVFKGQLPIREAQIIQEALNRVRVRYVPTLGFSSKTGRIVIERMRDRMGPIEVIMEEVDKVPRTTNGKFRAVVCALPAEERKRLKEDSFATTSPCSI